MDIRFDYPPNIEAIRSKFKLPKFVIFTYGHILYNPDRGGLPEHLMVHERTHKDQQYAMGVEAWWGKYLEDDKFRLSQEIEAYRNQYKYIVKNFKDRNVVNKMLLSIARDLSSEIYGNILTKDEALKVIKE